MKWGAFVLVEGAKDDSAVVLGDFCWGGSGISFVGEDRTFERSCDQEPGSVEDGEGSGYSKNYCRYHVCDSPFKSHEHCQDPEQRC